MHTNYFIIIILIILLLVVSCTRATPPTQIVEIEPPPTNDVVEPTTSSTPTEPAETTEAVETAVSTPTQQPTSTPAPIYNGPRSAACGQILPILPTNTTPTTTEINPDPKALAQLRNMMPENAVVALDRILEAPKTVGLVVYRVGDEANGVYINPDMQMPLASVAKLVTLAAYTEAVTAGEIDPNSVVTVADLERYYLPRYDLNAHPKSINELDGEGSLLKNPDAVHMEDLPWMMIRHSSNAASDYLHMLLGQERIEETAVSLNIASQTAPCTFIGQFLTTGNHDRPTSQDREAIDAYIANPEAYGEEVALLADAFSNDTTYREDEISWRYWNRGPSSNTQRYFSHELNAHGTPADYANLMALFAQNGLSSSESSYQARVYLEWPMQFPSNQGSFSNLGYKNGSLPGILNVAYYAYPLGDTTPIVITLFYRDLPNRTYRQWSRNFQHDEFARWILANHNALPALKAVLNP